MSQGTAAAALREVFAQLETLCGGCRGLEQPRLLRATAPLQEAAPLDWLAAQRALTQYYWAERDGAFAMAGVGEADIVAPLGAPDLASAFRVMRRRLSGGGRGLRYYGGLRFQPRAERPTRWKDFTEFRFVVPRIEMVKRPRNAVMAANLLAMPGMNLERELERLRDFAGQLEPASEASPPPLLKVAQRQDLPNRAGWSQMVLSALDAMAHDCFQKVVLARESTLLLDEQLDPVRLLQALLRETQRCYAFCFHPVHDRAFIGASPERLYFRTSTYLESEAVAGTRPRGHGEEADERLAHELLENEKDLREHQFVVRNLRDNLEQFARLVEVGERPEIMRLRHVQHLATPLRALLHAGVGDVRLLNVLHPTPAVGGAPRDAALAWLQEHEPFDRGIYAAPVGWVSYDAATFCVGIRSGLIKENRISLYTGAGIVPGSDPDSEWEEIEAKMEGFLHTLYT